MNPIFILLDVVAATLLINLVFRCIHQTNPLRHQYPLIAATSGCIALLIFPWVAPADYRQIAAPRDSGLDERIYKVEIRESRPDCADRIGLD